MCGAAKGEIVVAVGGDILCKVGKYGGGFLRGDVEWAKGVEVECKRCVGTGEDELVERDRSPVEVRVESLGRRGGENGGFVIRWLVSVEGG